MAKALKCDICGSFFDSIARVSIINKNTKPNKLSIYYRADNGNAQDECDIDICPECYLAIKKTLDERKKLRISPFEDDLK